MNKNIIKQIEQIKDFSYLSCSISHQNEKDITVKVSKFLLLTGMFNRHLKLSQVQKYSRPKTYNTLTLPTLLHGCETGAIREQGKNRDCISGKEMYKENCKIQMTRIQNL